VTDGSGIRPEWSSVRDWEREWQSCMVKAIEKAVTAGDWVEIAREIRLTATSGRRSVPAAEDSARRRGVAGKQGGGGGDSRQSAVEKE